MITKQTRAGLFLTALIFIISNCASTYDEPHKRRGKLSEAVEKSSNDNKGSRQVANTYQPRHSTRNDRYENDNNDDSPGLLGILFDILTTPSEEKPEPSHRPSPKPEYTPSYRQEILVNEQSKSLYSKPVLPIDLSSLPTDPAIKSVSVTVTDSSGKRRTYNITQQVESPIEEPKKKPVIAANTKSMEAPTEVIRPSPIADDTPPYNPPEVYEQKTYWDVNSSTLNPFFGFRLDNGLTYSNNLSGATGMSFVYANHSKPKRRWSLDAGLSYSPSNLESELSKSIDSYLEGHVGYQHRWYSTPDYTWMGLFFLLGADLRFMSWNYNNPVTSEVFDEYGESQGVDQISSDGINGVNAQIGIGWSFLQTRHAKFSAELSLNGAMYGFSTWEGFENDVFPASGQTRLTLEAVFGGKE